MKYSQKFAKTCVQLTQYKLRPFTELRGVLLEFLLFIRIVPCSYLSTDAVCSAWVFVFTQTAKQTLGQSAPDKRQCRSRLTVEVCFSCVTEKLKLSCNDGNYGSKKYIGLQVTYMVK
jgi:hypothetical protein